MLTIKTNAASAAKALSAIADQYPSEIGAGLSTAGFGVRKRIGAAMPSSSPPFAFSPLHPLSRASRIYLGRIKSLRAARAVASGNVSGFGGVLSLASSFRYVRSKWSVAMIHLEALWPYSQKFQTRETRPTTKEERHRMHQRGVHDFATYSRPARPIFTPVANDPATLDYIVDAVRKRIAALVEKRARMVRRAA